MVLHYRFFQAAPEKDGFSVGVEGEASCHSTVVNKSWREVSFSQCVERQRKGKTTPEVEFVHYVKLRLT